MSDKKAWTFCETPKEKCTMNYCDENGCQNRERVLVDPIDKQMSDIEEINKAQIFLLNTHIDDVVLNAEEYPENTKENAKEWIYLSSVLNAYSNQQQQTIDKLTKEVEGLKEKLQLERVVNVENKNQNNVISNWLVDYKEENTKLKEQLQECEENKECKHEFNGSYNIRASNETVEMNCIKCDELCSWTFDEFEKIENNNY